VKGKALVCAVIDLARALGLDLDAGSVSKLLLSQPQLL
jgi:hypothetical protein